MRDMHTEVNALAKLSLNIRLKAMGKNAKMEVAQPMVDELYQKFEMINEQLGLSLELPAFDKENIATWFKETRAVFSKARKHSLQQHKQMERLNEPPITPPRQQLENKVTHKFTDTNDQDYQIAKTIIHSPIEEVLGNVNKIKLQINVNESDQESDYDSDDDIASILHSPIPKTLNYQQETLSPNISKMSLMKQQQPRKRSAIIQELEDAIKRDLKTPKEDTILQNNPQSRIEKHLHEENDDKEVHPIQSLNNQSDPEENQPQYIQQPPQREEQNHQPKVQDQSDHHQITEDLHRQSHIEQSIGQHLEHSKESVPPYQKSGQQMDSQNIEPPQQLSQNSHSHSGHSHNVQGMGKQERKIGITMEDIKKSDAAPIHMIHQPTKEVTNIDEYDPTTFRQQIMNMTIELLNIKFERDRLRALTILDNNPQELNEYLGFEMNQYQKQIQDIMQMKHHLNSQVQEIHQQTGSSSQAGVDQQHSKNEQPLQQSAEQQNFVNSSHSIGVKQPIQQHSNEHYPQQDWHQSQPQQHHMMHAHGIQQPPNQPQQQYQPPPQQQMMHPQRMQQPPNHPQQKPPNYPQKQPQQQHHVLQGSVQQIPQPQQQIPHPYAQQPHEIYNTPKPKSYQPEKQGIKQPVRSVQPYMAQTHPNHNHNVEEDEGEIYESEEEYEGESENDVSESENEEHIHNDWDSHKRQGEPMQYEELEDQEYYQPPPQQQYDHPDHQYQSHQPHYNQQPPPTQMNAQLPIQQHPPPMQQAPPPTMQVPPQPIQQHPQNDPYRHPTQGPPPFQPYQMPEQFEQPPPIAKPKSMNYYSESDDENVEDNSDQEQVSDSDDQSENIETISYQTYQEKLKQRISEYNRKKNNPEKEFEKMPKYSSESPKLSAELGRRRALDRIRQRKRNKKNKQEERRVQEEERKRRLKELDEKTKQIAYQSHQQKIAHEMLRDILVESDIESSTSEDEDDFRRAEREREERLRKEEDERKRRERFRIALKKQKEEANKQEIDKEKTRKDLFRKRDERIQEFKRKQKEAKLHSAKKPSLKKKKKKNKPSVVAVDLTSKKNSKEDHNDIDDEQYDQLDLSQENDHEEQSDIEEEEKDPKNMSMYSLDQSMESQDNKSTYSQDSKSMYSAHSESEKPRKKKVKTTYQHVKSRVNTHLDRNKIQKKVEERKRMEEELEQEKQYMEQETAKHSAKKKKKKRKASAPRQRIPIDDLNTSDMPEPQSNAPQPTPAEYPSAVPKRTTAPVQKTQTPIKKKKKKRIPTHSPPVQKLINAYQEDSFNYSFNKPPTYNLLSPTVNTTGERPTFQASPVPPTPPSAQPPYHLMDRFRDEPTTPEHQESSIVLSPLPSSDVPSPESLQGAAATLRSNIPKPTSFRSSSGHHQSRLPGARNKFGFKG